MFFGGSRNRGARWKDEGGSALPWRPFVDAVGSGIAATDDAANGKTVLTVSGSGGASSPGLYYPSDYGTVGAGNDTTAVQGALTAAAAARGQVTIPGKSSAYQVAQLTSPNTDHFSIVGEGVPVLAARASGQARILYLANTGGTLERYAWVRGVQFDGGAGDKTLELVRASNCAYMRFQDCLFIGPCGVGLYGLSFLVNRIVDCQFHNTYADRSGTVGVDLTGTVFGDPAANQNVVRGCIFGHWEYAIRTAYGAGNIVTDCDIEQNMVGIEIGTQGGGIAGDAPNSIRGCWIEGNDLGIRIKSGSAPTIIQGCAFINKTASDRTITIESGAGPVVIDACFAVGGSSAPIRIDNQSTAGNVHVTNVKDYALYAGSNAVTEGDPVF